VTIIWIFLYNVIIVPLGFLSIQIYALFNEKMKEGIYGRKASWHDLKRFREKHPSKPVFLIHSASLGEFEQAKPVIRGLKAIRPDVLIVASFTSPSGFSHAERLPEVALMIYLPFDTFLRTRKFIQKLKPQKIIFVTYELWPNLIINAKRHHVSTYLMSARIRERSSKFHPLVRDFFRALYRSLDYIFAISEKDRKSVLRLTGSVPIKLLTLGDTRYDQVIERAKRRIAMDIPKLFDDGFIFIVGSIWPQDAKHVLPAVAKVLNEFSNFRCILAPHEPNEYALEMLEDHFIGKKFSTIRLRKKKTTPVCERIILIDRIGILAELYHQTRLAFVGGGFRNSVHNVMEPAVAGLPVLFGPNYHNSREAELLVESGGGFSCSDERHIYKIIKNLIKNSDAYGKASHSSRKIIMDNMGASARTVKEILENE